MGAAWGPFEGLPGCRGWKLREGSWRAPGDPRELSEGSREGSGGVLGAQGAAEKMADHEDPCGIWVCSSAPTAIRVGGRTNREIGIEQFFEPESVE